MSTSSNESAIYAALGVSSSKEGVHRALGNSAAAPSSPQYFVQLQNDPLGDPNYFSLLHADGAGTKTIVAYLAFRETGDFSWFSTLAQDSLVMNLDDAACIGAFENLMLSNTIGRNRHLVPDQAVAALIKGYRDLVDKLQGLGIPIVLGGGETADVGDLVRTVVVDSTIFGRVRRENAISTSRIASGDIIIALQGTGQTTYETEPNSSIGSNGFTLARHALISKKYCEKYPEILDPRIDPALAYRGVHDLFDTPAPLEISIAKALLSPTRTYAPILQAVFRELKSEIHGVLHCSGGGQTKCLRFGRGKHYIKENLFPCPPIYKVIQSSLQVPWEEMFSVFNMGHRIEIICNSAHLTTIEAIVKSFGIEARQIGVVHDGKEHNTLTIKSQFGEFFYE